MQVPRPSPFTLGHRGAPRIEPENTLSSFKFALDCGVDRIECDVHLSKDGHLMVIHDATLDRTVKDQKGAVNNYTLEQLKTFDAGKGQQIPTLQELFILLKQYSKVILHVELKGQGTPEATVKLIQAENIVSQVLVISFQGEWLQQVKELDGTIRTGLLVRSGSNASQVVSTAQQHKCDEIGCFFYDVTEEYVQTIHEKGFPLHCFNPDNEADMIKMTKLGVDGICSNFPDLLIQVLKKFSSNQ